ncbi:MAG: acyl-CoA synthetase [Ilumatobacter sp.]|uniref:acyl-CoA synthetase n=1 Tax=Ilumatobacter sp. TaxID=1967498 RepID=UPI00391BBF7F
MGNWNFADIWEVVADDLPDAICLIHGDDRRTWAEVDRRADGVARHLLDAGLERQQAVAQYLYNGPEYIESMFAAFKGAFAPVNTNYRYTADELLYLWDNADAGAIVFHGTFAPTIEPIRERLPKVKVWLWVDDGNGDCPDWATPYESVAATPVERVAPEWGRTGDDLNFLYTGGTTGMPKGVMWRQDDLAVKLTATLGTPLTDDGSVADLRGTFTAAGSRFLPACPQMHGTGNFPCLSTLSGGGSVVTLTNRTFDTVELLDTIEREGVNSLAIVGDAFAKPILRTLDEHRGRWDLSSLVGIVSSGVMWSKESKQGLLDHHPGMMLMDAFSSSEALGMGSSISSAGAPAETAKFELSPETIVIDDANRPLQPGSGEIGRLAVGGRQPVGYYKDPEKTARTFLEIDGQRYSCPGDFATIEADGTITLLGRGSVCINSGGEKIFPEEVEEAMKTHPDVLDAVAVGLPDDRFGEVVTGVVEPRLGATIDADSVIAHVKQRLAAYKAPKHIVVVDTIGRAANGKVDYKRLRTDATSALDV